MQRPRIFGRQPAATADDPGATRPHPVLAAGRPVDPLAADPKAADPRTADPRPAGPNSTDPAITADPGIAAGAAGRGGGWRGALGGVNLTHLQRRWVAVPILVVGVALVVGALPRTLAAFVSAGGEQVIRRIQKQEAVTVEDLQSVIDAQQRGLFWVSDALMESQLGLAHLLLAEKRDRADPAAAIHLQHARQALRASLGRAPANPYPWTLLAYAEFLDAGTWSPEALAALRLSLLTGPYEPRLLWSRLRLGLLAWDNLPESDQRLLLQQVRYAWAQDPKDLARLAIELKRVNLVRTALEQVPDASAAFEELLKAQGA